MGAKFDKNKVCQVLISNFPPPLSFAGRKSKTLLDHKLKYPGFKEILLLHLLMKLESSSIARKHLDYDATPINVLPNEKTVPLIMLE